MSINDVTRHLLLSDKQIIGLESDDHSSFYTLVYAERAAILYAEFLAVDLQLEGAPPFRTVADPQAKSSESARRPSNKSREYRYVSGAVVVLVLVVWIVSSLRDGTEPSVTTTVPSSEMSNQLPTSVDERDSAAYGERLREDTLVTDENLSVPSQSALAPTELPAAVLDFDRNDKANRFFVVITKPTIVIARDATGELLLSGEQVPSSGKRIVGKPPFTLDVVDPEAIEIYYQGKRIRPGRSDTPAITVTLSTNPSE
jgi:hypothetical protein